MKNTIIKIRLLPILVTMSILLAMGNGIVKAEEIKGLTEKEEKQIEKSESVTLS